MVNNSNNLMQTLSISYLLILSHCFRGIFSQMTHHITAFQMNLHNLLQLEIIISIQFRPVISLETSSKVTIVDYDMIIYQNGTS